MNKIISWPETRRRELFLETAARMKVGAGIIEKDFWVCWTLDALFTSEEWGKRLIFKGGTSLSKVFGLVSRFSEDIDLILDWQSIGVTTEEAWKARSVAQADKYNKKINAIAGEFIRNRFVPTLRILLSSSDIAGMTVQTDEKDPSIANVFYPRSFNDGSILPAIRLEIGPLASWVPHGEFVIRPYAAEHFPNLFEKSDSCVRAIFAERTFWEKATILHREAHRAPGKPVPPRQARHYYDLAMMAENPVKDRALADLKLLGDVVAFKRHFYPCPWAQYENAKPGTMRLVPPSPAMKALEADYSSMQNMIFNEAPPFQEMMTKLRNLEKEINAA